MKKIRDLSAISNKQQSHLEILQAQIYCYETLTKPLVQRKGQQKDRQQEIQKRKKKKQNRKHRQRTKKEQALSNLKMVIRSFYRLQGCFEQKRSIIENCLQIQIKEDIFFSCVNQVIRQQVDIISGQIHNLIKRLYESYKKSKEIDPYMITKLYEKVVTVQKASPQIQNVINYFSEKKHQGLNEHRNLIKLTFKFIFGSQQCKEPFQQLCGWIVQSCKDEMQTILVKKMRDLLQIIQQFEDEEYSSSQQTQTYDSQFSFQELQKLGQDIEKQNISNKKKKKNKKYSRLDEPLNYHIVIENFKKMEIQNGKRKKVNIDSKWLQELEHKIRQKL